MKNALRKYLLPSQPLLDDATRVQILKAITSLVAILALVEIPIFAFLLDPSLRWVVWNCIIFFIISCIVFVCLRFGYIRLVGILYASSITFASLFFGSLEAIITRPLGAQFVIPIVIIGFVVTFDVALIFACLIIIFLFLFPIFGHLDWSLWSILNITVITVVVFLMRHIAYLVQQLEISNQQEQQARYLVRYFQHELQNDVTGLRGLLPLARPLILRTTEPPSPIPAPADVMRHLQTTVDNLSNLLEELLIISREGALKPIQPEPVPVLPLLEQAQTMIRTRDRPRLAVSVDAPEDIIIAGSSFYLTLGVRAALQNALESLDQQPVTWPARIILSARIEDRRAIVRIEDNGLGFPDALLKLVKTARRTSEGRLATGWSTKTGCHGLGLRADRSDRCPAWWPAPIWEISPARSGRG